MKNEKVFFILLLALLFSILSFTAVAQETAEELYEEGVSYLLAGDYDSALELLNRSIELDPTGNPEAYLYRGAVYSKLGKHEDSDEECLKACEMGSVGCLELLPDILVHSYNIPKTTWAVGDFGYIFDSQGDSSYGPENVVDGLPETAWVTKADTMYIFEDMMIGFMPLADTTIREFTIRNGYCKNEYIWEKNSRVKKMLVLINNERVITVTLSDTMNEQTFSLGKEYDVKTDDVISFLILDVYPGTKYSDIAISELHLDYEINESNNQKDVAEVYSITKKYYTGDEILRTPAAADGVIFITDLSGVLYAVDTKTDQELWRFDSTSGLRVSPCVSEGIVYFGNRDSGLSALDARTGRELWRFEGDWRISSTPTVVNDVVCFTASASDSSVIDTLYTIDAKGGRELWRFEGEGGVFFLCGSDTGVVCFESDKTIHAADAGTGRELWRLETEGWTRSSPAVTDGVVYVGNTDGNLYAVDIKTGEELWRFKTGGLWFSSPVVADDAVYFGDEDGVLYSVDAGAGRELWRFQTEGSRCYSPIVVGDAVYFVSGGTEGGYDDTIYTLDTNTGELLWKRGARGSSPVYINGVVYLAGEFGVSALNAHTGEEIWAFDTFFIMCTDPVAVDGVIYFGCEDGYLYAVE